MPTVIFPLFLFTQPNTGYLAEPYTWMLLKAPYSPDPYTQTHVDDISTDEITDASYSRTLFTSKTVIFTYTKWPLLGADDPDFGAVVGGEVANYLVAFRKVTTDADSPLVAAWPISKTLDGTPTIIEFLEFPDYSLFPYAGNWSMRGQSPHPSFVDPLII